MKEFTARSSSILDAIFASEYDPRVEDSCDCGRPDAQCTIRCVDCFARPPACAECNAESHVHLPFHRLQQWTGRYFRRWSLARCSLDNRTFAMWLGHDGAPCPSLPKDTPGRAFTIIDTNGIHNFRIVYCRCPHAPSEPHQLISASLYPSTWDSPKTAFTFRVMKHYHLDSLQSRKPAYDYWAVLRRLTDNTRSKGLSVRYLVLSLTWLMIGQVRYEELLRVSREWRCLMRLKRSGQALGISTCLPNESTSVAVVCPACPRPGFNMPEDWREKQTSENA